jgi:GNAT superfamily N-acetyltransferase
MVTIRQAQNEDADGLLHVASRFPSRSYLNFFGVMTLLTDSNTCLMAAHAEGEVVGYLLGYDQHRYAGVGGLKDAAWVEELMVAEDFRSRGIGSLLMQRFEDWARNRHCRLVAVGYEFLRQPVCSLFYLQSITIIPIIIITAIHAAHMTQTAARSGMCKNFATIIVNRLTIRRDLR